jgi:2,5-furandicarboxylate decarboxylase 1
MAKDLRTFLQEYEQAFPEGIARIDRPINARYEVTALVIHADRHWSETPVIILNNLINHQGVKSPYRSIVNLFASKTRRCWAVGSTVRTYARDLYRKGIEQGLDPVRIAKNDAPVKHTIQTGTDVDLYRFAPLVHHYLDPGPYTSSGAILCYDPDTGVDNSTIQRGWIAAKDEIRWWPIKQSDNHRVLQRYEERGKDMPIVCWIGHHPAAMIGGNLGVAPGHSHLRAAGGVLGEPIRMVPSETLGNDFLVPADAEIVIEGIVPAGQRKPEGPFGEAWGHTGGQRWNPFIRVTAVTHRDNPYWVSNMISHKDEWEGAFTDKRSMVALEIAKKAVPTVVDVRNSSHPGIVYVQLDQKRPGEAIEAGLVAAASKYGNKMVIVVDTDIDIYDDQEIWLALASRVQWDTDIQVIPGGRGASTDPSLIQDGVSSKIVINATKPLPSERPFSVRNSVPKETLEKIRLADYFPQLEARKVEKQC